VIDAAAIGTPIRSIAIAGASATVLDGSALVVGQPLDAAAIAAEIRRLWRLGVFDDVAIRAHARDDGVAIEIAVRERPVIASVDFAPATVDPWRLRRLRTMVGAIHDPGRVRRTATRLEESLRGDGHWHARVAVTERAGPRGVALCVAIAPGRRYIIDRIEFPGRAALDHAALAGRIAHDTVNRRGGAFRPDLLDLDLVQLEAAYWDAGHAMVRVRKPFVRVDERRARITVIIPVDEGPTFTVGKIAFTGVAAGDEATYRARLAIRSGMRFSRSALRDAFERVRALEKERGRPGNLTPITDVDVNRRRIDITIEVTP
jgi:outer membrane protein assembly factor BamA